MILEELYDNFYPNEGYTTIRKTVRGLIFKEGKVALIHIKCQDGFGDRDHYEIPGGGIESGEDPIQALKRELKEETGIEVEVEDKIARVIDRWNYLKRINVHDFYLCKFISQGESHLTDYEQEVILGIEWHSVSQWIHILEQPLDGINQMIHSRELIVFEEIDKKKRKP